MKNKIITRIIIFVCLVFTAHLSIAQTEIDAIMMNKKQFCTGFMYSKSNWKNYWEGTNKRDNANLGNVSSQEFSVQGNYGVKDNLNVLFSLPYISTKATAGTMHSMKGLQDFSLFVKYMAVEKQFGIGVFSIYGIGGLSFPTSNYVADFLPLSIGLRTTNLSFRGMIDYQINNWFATASAAYVRRSNIKLDRNAYYTTELHYTNEVKMPDAVSYNVRAGFRTEKLIAEAVLNNWATIGGFDITKNNMPFPSNKMNSTTIGFNGKYYLKYLPNLSVNAGLSFTVAGRNVGEATRSNIGAFYVFGNGKHKG